MPRLIEMMTDCKLFAAKTNNLNRMSLSGVVWMKLDLEWFGYHRCCPQHDNFEYLLNLSKYSNTPFFAKALLLFTIHKKPQTNGNFPATDIPGITVHPDNVTEKEGKNATLLCNAMGNPVPKISWNKGGLPLSNNSRVNLSADNKHLTITNVKRVDSGEYRCVATNSLGYVTSNPAYLGVQCKWNILVACSFVSYP